MNAIAAPPSSEPVDRIDCEVCDAVVARIWEGQQYVAYFVVDNDDVTFPVCRDCASDLGGRPVIGVRTAVGFIR